jgi:hypothetical protein
MKKRRRFQEGGDIPNIDREPLRDSSGEIVRDSSGEAIMSGGADKDRAMGIAMREARDAAAIDQAMLREPKVAQSAPVREPKIELKGDTDLVEPSTAGFNRAPIKTPPKAKPKSAAKPAAKPAKASDRSMSSFAPDARAGRSTNVSYLRKDRFGMEPDMYIARRRMKEGFKAGGKVGSASKRADGIASKGKTRGRII